MSEASGVTVKLLPGGAADSGAAATSPSDKTAAAIGVRKTRSEHLSPSLVGDQREDNAARDDAFCRGSGVENLGVGGPKEGASTVATAGRMAAKTSHPASGGPC
jgi:hypothetical protein